MHAYVRLFLFINLVQANHRGEDGSVKDGLQVVMMMMMMDFWVEPWDGN